jgi:hypothetical protein
LTGNAREIVRDYAQWVATPKTPQTVIRASGISEGWRLSFWDSLILAAAEEQDCSTVLTENLNSGQTVVGIQIINPFFSRIRTCLSGSSMTFPFATLSQSTLGRMDFVSVSEEHMGYAGESRAESPCRAKHSSVLAEDMACSCEP